MVKRQKQIDCNHEFEEISVITFGANSRMATICKKCGVERDDDGELIYD